MSSVAAAGGVSLFDIGPKGARRGAARWAVLYALLHPAGNLYVTTCH